MNIETISLSDLLRRQWGVSDSSTYPHGTSAVDAARKKEHTLRGLLPHWLVRRLDAGFARSNTVHPDTGHALYAICRASGAQHVFESGTYWGYSTAYLAAALRDGAASGKVWSFDIYSHAGKHIPKGLRPHIELRRGRPSAEAMPKVLAEVKPDLFFQDSRHDYEGVFEELRVVVPHLKPEAVVLFHDFVAPDVRRAALEVMTGYQFYVLDSADPQQLGITLKHIT